jgi:hypothetical protein
MPVGLRGERFGGLLYAIDLSGPWPPVVFLTVPWIVLQLGARGRNSIAQGWPQ